jgi:hypothetical protein
VAVKLKKDPLHQELKAPEQRTAIKSNMKQVMTQSGITFI